ncbi:MAG: arylsulfatase [Planctomycetota bacterium]|jgi:arylsulfatase A-like enzyme
MTRYRSLVTIAGLGLLILSSCVSAVKARIESTQQPPNIIFIMADDLGYGELGCYGQDKIKTPNIDRLAVEGMRFTQCYAGCSVCAPSRSVLMTGLHSGHTPIRVNVCGTYLYPEDFTVAELLKQAGYVTGCFGKWGSGEQGTPGHPNRQGFDEFFGQLNQVHAHFYYPYYLWKNETEYYLPENEGKRRNRYAHDEIHAQAMDFIRSNKDKRMFCYIPYIIPHVELVVPEDSMKPYLGKFDEVPLADPRKGYIGADKPYATFAGMVSRMDGHVGEIVALLKELGIHDNTVVFFTSDNGGQGHNWKGMTDYFKGNAPLRGYKGSFYEGGIRVPMVVCWPGRIKPGSKTDHICGFWDVMPTLADLAGVEPPENIDGISFLPTLLNRGDQQEHEHLYWELVHVLRNGKYERVCALRMGDWKVVQPRRGKPFELYNLAEDISETTDLAGRRPAIMAKIKDYLKTARTDNRNYMITRFPKAKDYVR